MRALVAVVTLGWLGAGTAAFGQAPLDIIGIKAGMPVSEALEILKAHDPKYAHPNQTETEVLGVPTFISIVQVQGYSPKAEGVRNELIVIQGAPGDPGIVVGAQRDVSYKPDSMRSVEELAKNLGAKYGVPGMSTDVGDEFKLTWFFDSEGKSIDASRIAAVKPKDPRANCEQYFGGGIRITPYFGGEGYLRPFAEGKSPFDYITDRCGTAVASYVHADITRAAQHRELATQVMVIMSDMGRATERFKPAAAAAKEAAQKEKERIESEAAKRKSEF
jgi:hypothetical protein